MFSSFFHSNHHDKSLQRHRHSSHSGLEHLDPIPLLLDQTQACEPTKHHAHHGHSHSSGSRTHHHHHKHSCCFKFMELPQYIQEYILGFLLPRDCCAARLVCKHWRIMATCDSVWSRIAEAMFSDCVNWTPFYQQFCSSQSSPSFLNLVMNSLHISLSVCHAFVGAAAVSPTRAVVISADTTLRQIHQIYKDTFCDDQHLQMSYSFASASRAHLHVAYREPEIKSLGGPSSLRSQSPFLASSSPPSYISSLRNSGSSSSESGSPPSSPVLVPAAGSPSPSAPSPESMRCSVCSVFGARNVGSPPGLYEKLTARDVGIRSGDSLELLVCHS